MGICGHSQQSYAGTEAVSAPVLKFRITSTTNRVSMTSSTTNMGVDGCLMVNPMSQQEMMAVAMAEAVMIASHAALRQPVAVSAGMAGAACEYQGTPAVAGSGSESESTKQVRARPCGVRLGVRPGLLSYGQGVAVRIGTEFLTAG